MLHFSVLFISIFDFVFEFVFGLIVDIVLCIVLYCMSFVSMKDTAWDVIQEASEVHQSERAVLAVRQKDPHVNSLSLSNIIVWAGLDLGLYVDDKQDQ